MYYLLSGYICALYCEYIYNYIYIYISIYWFISFICIFLFYLFTCCIVLFFYLFITYIIIYIERERSYTTSEIKPYLLLPGCKWLRRHIGPSEASSGRLRVSRVRLSSGASEWELSVEGLVSYKKWWDKYGIYIYPSIHSSIHLCMYACMHACMYIYICVYILILI